MDKSEIGNTGTPVTMHMERGKIREFAKAIKDDNPIYLDEAHAKRVAGGIMPPPTFSMTQAFWEEGPRKPLLTYDVRRLLHGEQEFEYLAPVPYRGKRNEPAYLRETVQALAALRGVTPDAMAARLRQNIDAFLGRPFVDTPEQAVV